MASRVLRGARWRKRVRVLCAHRGKIAEICNRFGASSSQILRKVDAERVLFRHGRATNSIKNFADILRFFLVHAGRLLHALRQKSVEILHHVGMVSGEILRDFDADGTLSWR